MRWIGVIGIACAHGVCADVLVDYGITPSNRGVVVAGADTAGGGVSAFQRFTVSDPEGWVVSSAQIHLTRPIDPLGDGMAYGIFPEMAPYVPDANNPIGSGGVIADPGGLAVLALGHVQLAPGNYFFGVRANGPAVDGGWFAALTTNPEHYAVSVRLADGSTILQNATLTLRLEGAVVPTPAIVSVAPIGGLWALSRRRRPRGRILPS